MTEKTQPTSIAALIGLSPDKLKQHASLAQGIGIAFIILGILAILLPGPFSLGIELFLGWLLLIGGLLQLIGGFSSLRSKGGWLQLLGGVLSVVVGVLFLLNPFQGVAVLTMFLAAFFFVNGIFRIFYVLGSPGAPGNALAVLNGIFGIIIGVLVWSQWPTSSAWFIGLLVGIDMLFFGMSLLTVASAIKKEQASG